MGVGDDMDNVVIGFIVFFYGSVFTSFFTLIGMRIPNEEPINGRSVCDQCRKVIPWYALIPVFGYFISGAKCVHCGERIAIKYPIYEFVGGLLFVLAYFYVMPNVFELVIVNIMLSLMIIVTVSDIEYKVVPNVVLLVFAPFIFGLRVFLPLLSDEVIMSTGEALTGGVVGFLFMWLIAWYGKMRFKQDALGGGDIKLYFVIGLFLGIRLVFLSLFFASILGIIIGRLVIKKMNPIPFVPFIFFGVIMTYVFGFDLLEWYLSLF